MRQSKQTGAEIMAAEIAAADRKETRATGFAKMSERDAGYHRLSNGILMIWPTIRKPVEYEGFKQLPDGKFMLVIGGKEYLFDTDEFRQSLRWA